MTAPQTAKALYDTLISTNESDSNLEAANVVDGLFFIGRALFRLAKVVEELGPTVPSPEELEVLLRTREGDE